MLAKILLTGSAALIGLHCSDDDAARPAQVIYISEAYDTRFEAERGDTIHVVMEPHGDLLSRCDHMGGVLATNEYTNITYCLNVDF